MIRQFSFEQCNLSWVNKVKWFRVLLCITDNSIKYQSFVCILLNDQTVLFHTIQVTISYFFVLSLNVEQFYLTYRQDLIRCYRSGPEWPWERWQWRGTLHSPKLQHYWSLTIRLFNVISGHSLVVGGLTPLPRCNRCILQPRLTGLADEDVAQQNWNQM